MWRVLSKHQVLHSSQAWGCQTGSRNAACGLSSCVRVCKCVFLITARCVVSESVCVRDVCRCNRMQCSLLGELLQAGNSNEVVTTEIQYFYAEQALQINLCMRLGEWHNMWLLSCSVLSAYRDDYVCVLCIQCVPGMCVYSFPLHMCVSAMCAKVYWLWCASYHSEVAVWQPTVSHTAQEVWRTHLVVAIVLHHTKIPPVLCKRLHMTH